MRLAPALNLRCTCARARVQTVEHSLDSDAMIAFRRTGARACVAASSRLFALCSGSNSNANFALPSATRRPAAL